MAEATAPINPLMDPQTAEYVTKWPSAVNTGFVLTMAYLGALLVLLWMACVCDDLHAAHQSL